MRILDYLLIRCLVCTSCLALVCGRPEGAAAAAADDDTDQPSPPVSSSLYADALASVPGTWHEVVHPVLVRMNEALPDLDSRDHKVKQKTTHFHSMNLEMNMLTKRHRIRLELNRDLLGNGFKLKHDQSDKVQVIEETTVENCFYQGQMRRFPNSLVIVSTCNGIRGVIILQHQMYFIQPLSIQQNITEGPRNPHVLFYTVPSATTSCANDRGMWGSYKVLHHVEFLRSLKINKEDEELLQETKFIRLALAIDSTLFSRLNGTVADAVHYAALVTNMVDAMFNDTNVRIRMKLVYAEVWNRRDPFTVSTNARDTLMSFMQYRQDAMTRATIDFAHLLTGQQFNNDELGMAIPDSICSNRSVAVSQVTSVHDLWQAAYGIVHMLGHVLGVAHDTADQCTCSARTGCIMTRQPMNSLSLHARSWSKCSIKDIHTSLLSRLSSCLITSPTPTEANYVQRCGNGIVERGEECDCQNDEECELTDPCCDAKTCLLKPWATCRSGDCCHNCTVQPFYQMCRDSSSECDVPEFCDGISGKCPLDANTQDGQLCGSGEGYCYRGKCQTYTNQCQQLWGPASSAADGKCYDTFNPAGRFNGHCGVDAASGDYVKCATENSKCGLLHCAGGVDKPLIAHNQTFSKTVVYSDGREYECKIVNGAPELIMSSQRVVGDHVGMVSDGSRCAPGSVCIGSACIALSHVMPVTCITGSNGLVCSGHGVCTTDVRCYCFAGYTGSDCSERTNVTFIPLSTTTPAASFTLLATTVNLNNSVLLANDTLTSDTNASAIALPGKPPISVSSSSSTTWWLIFVLAGVILIAVLVLTFCLLCYRRRSPLSSGAGKKKVLKRSTFGSVTSFSSHKSHDSYDPVTNRIISFGKMPSYKEEKLKRAMKRYQQQQRGSAASETASDRSRTDRDSTEIKAVTLPLAAPPERGILKTGKVRGSKASRAATLPSPRQSAVLDAENPDNKTTLLPSENTTSSLPPQPAAELDFIDDDDDDCCSCSCDEGDDDEAANKVRVPPGGNLPAGGNVTAVPKRAASDCSRETQTDPESLASSVTSVCDADSKRARLSNINELLRQIDEQFNSVLRVTSLALPDDADRSPTNSDDVRASDPEADRGFFRQQQQQSAAADAVDRAADVRGFRPVMRPLAVTSGSHSEPESALKSSRVHQPAPSSSGFVPYRGMAHASPLDDRRVPPLHRPIAVSLPLVSSSPATVASEGYFSDRVGGSVEPEMPVIIREIPTNVVGARRAAAPTSLCTDTAQPQLRLSSGLLNSPEDVNV